MYCPNARCPDNIRTGLPGEYVEGVTICPFCGTSLVPRRPHFEEEWDDEAVVESYAINLNGENEAYEPERELVAIADYLTAEDAHMALSFLVANGIEAYLMPDDRTKASRCGADDPMRLVVGMSQAEDALFLLKDIDSVPDQRKKCAGDVVSSGNGQFCARSISTAFTTYKIDETKAFYTRYFSATVTFDCGWYINLSFNSENVTLQFMSPQKPEHRPCNSAGLVYNVCVDDVDREYKRLAELGLTPAIPLQNQPWGDRSFAVEDPNGIILYIYSEREPDEEYRKFYAV